MDPVLSCDVLLRYVGGPQISAAFEVPASGFSVTVLFGPSGSGKTTLLRCLAGLERPEGSIRWGAEVWLDSAQALFVPPRRRQLGFVAQDSALFPHLNVLGNVVYGLQRMARVERQERGLELLAWLGLQELADRLPAEISGGQRQRVALARALAPRPRLLLLDEPLSALDGPARLRLRQDLRRTLRELALPSVLVTHDRSEAIQLGDRIVVLDGGQVKQVDSVRRVFDRPADPEVARIVGMETVAAGPVVEVAGGLATVALGSARILAPAPEGLGAEAFVCIRAEDVILEREEGAPTTARNRLAGRVIALHPEGAMIRVGLDCGFPLESLITRRACQELALAPGVAIIALIKANAIHLIPRG
ncbi:MAG TPA: ATP-binding cassette domain-containing protein [Vicinamibacteria bacterium]|nr:ATP-binding cassette domain-containing protein [Vicinamibacteria bacterium]